MKNIKKMKKKFVTMFSCICISTVAFVASDNVYATENTEENTGIIIDGELADWKAMDALTSSDGNISEWKLAKSEDGKWLYFSFTGPAVTVWDTSYNWKWFSMTFDNGTYFGNSICNLADSWILPGASVEIYSNASGNNAGIYNVECALPMNQAGYTINFAGQTVSETDIPVFVPAEKVEPVYNGIVIDGNYDDWDAVTKYEAECPEEAYHSFDCLDLAACVFDGDYFYIYLKDGATGYAAGAGVNSNGRYAIETDMGRQITFQLSSMNGGTVNGVDDVEVKYFGNEWEIAIPAEQLPIYKETLSFGLYQQEPFVSGIMNLQGGDANGTAGEFTGIVYDGLYGDWASYPHKLIQYTTAGTHTNFADGEGALYMEDGTLYGHVVCTMGAHSSSKGEEFAHAVSIYFNGDHGIYGDKSWNLHPMLVAVDEEGNINWNPKTGGLANGKYEFYIADVRGEYDRQKIKNISDLKEHEQFFGKMTMTINDTKDEMEYCIDLEQVAKFLSYYSKKNIDASDFKMVEAQYGMIGNEYVTIAGTSSGPYAGVALCVTCTALIFLKRRRNRMEA